MSTAEQILQEVLEAFDFGGHVLTTQRYGGGHVNDTFLIHTSSPTEAEGHFILQRLSPVAFSAGTGWSGTGSSPGASCPAETHC